MFGISYDKILPYEKLRGVKERKEEEQKEEEEERNRNPTRA